MWWMSHYLAGRSQPGWVQCRSRAITARLIAAGTTRVVRPMSTGSPAGPNTIRLIVLSQQIRRMSSGVRTFAGALSVSEYRSGLEAAGFSSISLTPTHRVTDGLDSMIVRAVKP
jgi:hypothetical protein